MIIIWYIATRSNNNCLWSWSHSKLCRLFRISTFNVTLMTITFAAQKILHILIPSYKSHWTIILYSILWLFHYSLLLCVEKNNLYHAYLGVLFKNIRSFSDPHSCLAFCYWFVEWFFFFCPKAINWNLELISVFLNFLFQVCVCFIICVRLHNMLQRIQLFSGFHTISILLGDLISSIKEAMSNFVSDIVKFQVNIQKFFVWT